VIGSSCTYVCGRDASSVFALYCSANGQWVSERQDTFPPCAKQCGVPLSPSNGRVMCFSNHTSCRVACDAGFTLEGPDSITCQMDSRTWSAEPTSYRCVASRCEQPPPVIQHGRVACESNSVGQTCETICDPGYSLTGSGKVKCSSEGKWNTHNTHCELRACDRALLSAVQLYGGDIAVDVRCQEVKSRQICSPFCPQGYVLDGPEVVSCDAFGRWSETSLRCRAITCPQVHEVANGKISCSGSRMDDYCDLVCDRGFEPLNAVHVVCGDTGIWDGGALSCVPTE
jgi:hypothetical protein